jgi:hypothetical protein
MADGHSSVDQISLSPTDLLRLRTAAQARGRLTLDDLKRILPIERLSHEQIGHIVGQLEDAAVDIEIDPALMRPPRNAAPTLNSGFRIASDDEDASYTRARPVAPAREAVTPVPHVPAPPIAGGRRTTALVIAFVLLVCAILGYIASLLM